MTQRPLGGVVGRLHAFDFAEGPEMFGMLDQLLREAARERLSSGIHHLVVLREGMSKKEIGEAAARLTAIPDHEPRVLLATGRYIGEGFDDARLDTLFLTLPVSWHGTIAQYVGRLHRLHHRKREVRVYDYAVVNGG